MPRMAVTFGEGTPPGLTTSNASPSVSIYDNDSFAAFLKPMSNFLAGSHQDRHTFGIYNHLRLLREGLVCSLGQVQTELRLRLWSAVTGSEQKWEC